MIRNLTYLILIAITNTICLSQTYVDKSDNNCYSEGIRLNIKEKIFKDTIVLFRNYIDKFDDKRIICNDNIFDIDIDKLIWECKYISTYLTYQNRMNKFSIVSYKIYNKTDTIAYYYLCDRKTKETVEMVRFKIAKKKIIGINILPNIYDGFVPIDEFDNQKIDRID